MEADKKTENTAGDRKLLLRTEHLVKEFPIGGTKKDPLASATPRNTLPSPWA